jgi:hypothetical protein
MTITNRIRKLGLTAALGAAAVVLAVTASGCFGGNGGCLPDVFVDWQIQNSAGAPVTCAGAGAATVVINIDGVVDQHSCQPGASEGAYDEPLQSSGTYNISVSLFDAGGNSLAPAQSITLDVQSCGSAETPMPAVLVVSPTAS